ncbi:hypothetical protein BH23GEM6_BH23GEM6_13250 [soil metagenome]
MAHRRDPLVIANTSKLSAAFADRSGLPIRPHNRAVVPATIAQVAGTIRLSFPPAGEFEDGPAQRFAAA